MKWTAILITALLVLPVAGFCADATNTTKVLTSYGSVLVRSVDCVANSSNAAYSAYTFKNMDGYILKAQTTPGTLTPTDNYDILIVDEDGLDVFGDTGTVASPAADGGLANRDSTQSEIGIPPYSTFIYPGMPVRGDLTMYIYNNAVNSAAINVKLFFTR